MTDEDRRRFEDLVATFATDGWRHFIEEFSDVASSLDTIQGVNDERTLDRNKGKLDTLNILLTYEDAVRRALDESDI
jgi:hypothetical protein